MSFDHLCLPPETAPAPLPPALPASFVAVATVLAIAPARTPTQVSAPIQNVGRTMNMVPMTNIRSMSPQALFNPTSGSKLVCGRFHPKDRQSVVTGRGGTVRVDRGGDRQDKKKK